MGWAHFLQWCPLQSPPPTEGGRRSQDSRLTTVHPPGGAAHHCAVGQTTDARGPEPPARGPEPPARDPGTAPRREMKHLAPAGRNLHASSPSPQSAPPPLGQPSPHALRRGQGTVQTLDRTESERPGIQGMRKMLKYIFGSWESEVKARRDQMKSFNDSFRPDAKG